MRDNATASDQPRIQKLLDAIQPEFSARETEFNNFMWKQGADALKAYAAVGVITAATFATGGTALGVIGGGFGSISLLSGAGTVIALDFAQASARGLYAGRLDPASTGGGTLLNYVPGIEGYGEQVYVVGSVFLGAVGLARETPGIVNALRGPASERAIGSIAAAENVAQTGARQVLNPRTLKGWDAAEPAYDTIRANSGDIAEIARNTGMPEWRVARIKDHLFFKEHQLDLGLKRFDADPDIVNAWSRLGAGDHIPSDVSLLRHEIFESKFEGIFRTNYRTAHDAAIRSGRPWVPGE